MRRSFGRQDSPESFPSTEESAFPILSKGGTPPKSPSKRGNASKLGCAFQALKCSSRASEEDNFPTQRYTSKESIEWQADFESKDNQKLITLSSTEELDRELSALGSPRSPTTYEKTDRDRQDFATFQCPEQAPLSKTAKIDKPFRESTANGEPSSERRLMPANFKHVPRETFEDIPLDDELTPQRISSEDTHDTPPLSNMDPNRPQRNDVLTTEDEPNTQFDALCQTYFNTPKVIRSAGSLGDSITPSASPAEDDEEEEHGDSSPKHRADRNLAKRFLQMPTMGASSQATSDSNPSDSSASLLGEALAYENKFDDEHDVPLTLVPDNASVKIGQQEVKATISLAESPPPKKLTKPLSEKSGYESLTTDDSSFSSVSSFAEVAGKSKKRDSNLRQLSGRRAKDGDKSLTPHPFFWRSHPDVTVTSYDLQTKPSIRKVVPKLETVHMMDDYDFNMSAKHTASRRRSNSPPEGRASGHYAPYLHPAAVRKLWMESKPFRLEVNSNWQTSRSSGSNRHPQGPPSTRSSQLVQSLTSFGANLPAVFSRSESSSTRMKWNESL
jgi:hypothetical protein